jgi:hypothetical protein
MRGWHACRWEDLPHYICAELWIVEVDAQIVHDSDKIACEQMMLVEQVTAWDDRMARLFAADCAEQVLPIFEAKYPADDRPRRAIEAARAYADGLIPPTEVAAARNAAWDAAGAAAGDATRDAARAAAWAAAWAAARAAARAAAGAAAGAATWAAVRDAERRWQADHLGEMLGLDPTRFMHRENP